MKYQIFALIQKIRFDPNDYYRKAIPSYILEQNSEYPDSYDTFELARENIFMDLNRFKQQKLTILPIFDIDYEGKN